MNTTTEAAEQNDQHIEETTPRSTKSTRQHPLEHSWSLWFHNPISKPNENNYFHNLNKVYTVDTVEKFWGLYNHIMTPSKLGIGCTYYMFKGNIKPEWESKECEGGGEWVIQLLPNQQEKMDKFWLHAILACIGAEVFSPECDHVICGVAVGIRKAGLKISLWIGKTSEEMIKDIGQKFREALLWEIPEDKRNETQLSYRPFADQLKGLRVAKYTIP